MSRKNNSSSSPSSSSDAGDQCCCLFWFCTVVITFSCLIPLVIIPAFRKDSNRPADICPPVDAPIRWVKDANLSNWQMNLNVYSGGPVTYERMLTICDRLNRANMSKSEDQQQSTFNALHVNSANFEGDVDRVVLNHKDYIFGNNIDDSSQSKILWIGFYFLFNRTSKTWIDNFRTRTNYRNFCDPKWAERLDEKLNHPEDHHHRIHIVKDYRGNSKGCWELFSIPELVRVLHYYPDSIPKLPFVCLSKIRTGQSGLAAVPGSFRPIYSKPTDRFVFYGVQATYAEAKEECNARSSRVISADSLERYADLQFWMNQSYSVRPGSREGKPSFIWTGGYFDLKSNNPYQLRWEDKTAETNVSLPFIRDPSRNQAMIEEALAQFNSKLPSTCPDERNAHIIRVGMASYWSVGKKEHVQKLTLMSDYEETGISPDNPDPRAYVACELNSSS